MLTILPPAPDDGPGNVVGGLTGAPVASVLVSLGGGAFVGKGADELGRTEAVPLDGCEVPVLSIAFEEVG